MADREILRADHDPEHPYTNDHDHGWKKQEFYHTHRCYDVIEDPDTGDLIMKYHPVTFPYPGKWAGSRSA